MGLNAGYREKKYLTGEQIKVLVVKRILSKKDPVYHLATQTYDL
jgi:hypothetical protein